MSQQVIDILLKIDARVAAIEGAQRAVSKLSTSFSSLGRVAGTIAGVNLSLQGGAAIIRGLVTQASELGDKFGNLAERFGTTSEAIQVADYAARRFGQGIDEVAAFSDRLQARLAEARAEGGAAAKAFGDMGLSIAALERLSWERRLEAFGRALIAGEGDARVYAAAVEIAGTSSQKFFDVLRGVSAFDEVGARAKAAGQVLDTEMVQRLAAINQKMEDLQRRAVVLFSYITPLLDLVVTPPEERELFGVKGLVPPERLRPSAAGAAPRASPGAPAGAGAAGGAAAEALPDAAAIRAEQAQIWLASEEARRMRERVQATEQALATDQRRLEVQQARLAALDRERVAALQAAGSQAEREQVALRYSDQMLEVMKDIEATQKAIGAASKQDEAERRKALELEMQRRRVVIDRLQFERDQVGQREDISEVEKQRQIRVLVEAQRAIVADMLRLKREALATASEAERVQLDADIEALEQERQTLGRGVDPQAVSWERQIALADSLRAGIDGISQSLASAAVAGTDLRETLSNVFKQIAMEILAATIKALIFKAIVGASGGSSTGLAGMLGLSAQGYAGGGYTGPGPRGRVAGVVHAGEGVIDKPTLDRLGGRPFFERLLGSLRSGAGYASGGYVSELAGRTDLAAAAGMGAGDALTIHNHFEVGMTPAEFAAMLPDMERRQRRGVIDAQRRKREGMR